MKHAISTLVILLALAMLSDSAAGRDLAVSEDDLIAVELASVGVEPMTGTPVVLLREPESGSIVPIFIGPNEARAILIAQRGIQPERPMTHDLTSDIIHALGASLKRVIVDELRNSTYLGALELTRHHNNTTIHVDTRPSDGLALAVRAGASIFVAPAILEAGEDIPFRGLGDDEDVVTAIGITVMAANAEIREALGLPDEPGVVVTATRAHAEQAGLRAGALILSVNEETISTPMAFLEQITAAARQRNAKIRFWHDGEHREIELSTEVPDAPGERRRL